LIDPAAPGPRYTGMLGFEGTPLEHEIEDLHHVKNVALSKEP
jgi:hypothetical protein